MALVARVHGALMRARTVRATSRIRLAARLAGVDLDLSIAPTAHIGRIDVRFESGTRALLHIGEHTVVDDDVEIRFNGGLVRIGDWCQIRRGVRVMASGDLDVRGQNVLSWGMVIHCADAVALHRQSTFGEYVSISDSVHLHLQDEWHVDQLRTAPVTVGADTWVGAKATITRGVQVGEHCVVAAGAVVTRDVPDHHVALGVPAATRPLVTSDPARPE